MLAKLATAPGTTITRDVVGGTVVKKKVFTAKDGTDWRSTPLAQTAQTSAVNIVNLPVGRIPQKRNRKAPS